MHDDLTETRIREIVREEIQRAAIEERKRLVEALRGVGGIMRTRRP